jgi:GNAT superfamily N-acetyltransferase
MTELRVATADDTPAVVALYDEAVDWLAGRGLSDQWGTKPFSERPDVVALIRARVESGAMWLAHNGGLLLGAIVLGDEAPSYVDPAGEREIYISGFITSRAPDARAAGRLLLHHAKTAAADAGISLLRLDCYAGGTGGLVAYYESVGFEQVTRFTVDLSGVAYTGCLLELRLTGAHETGGWSPSAPGLRGSAPA